MSKKILYFECYSGISGDMTVASLLDLGADKQVLMDALESLNIGGFKIEIGRTKKCGIDACSFDVILDDEKEMHNHEHSHDYAHEHNNKHEHEHGHEHDHAHDHGHNHDHNHDHEHSHDHNHDHEHSHDHEHTHEHSHDHEHTHEHSHDHEHTHEHSHDHEHTHEHGHEHAHEHNHRNINDIYKIIDESKISEKAKSIAKKIFHVVAMAEAKAHGVAMEEVHFHEVGAVDSIVDIVATAVCIDNLKVNDIVVSELYEGTGHVRCQHGIIPVPVPAVVNIVSDHALKIRITDAQGEMITPTGAAIVAALKTQDELPKVCRIEKVGIGAGKKDFKRANILRAFLIETEVSEKTCNCEQTSEGDSVWVLETNIDDSTGENLGYVMNKLFEAGARDVFFTPIYMKKNRPSSKLTVICSEEKIKAMEDLIFKNTSSIGIRRYKAERTILAREIIEVGTKYGKVKVKLCYHGSEKYYYPEYGDVESICNRTGKSFKQVYEEIKLSCMENND